MPAGKPHVEIMMDVIECCFIVTNNTKYKFPMKAGRPVTRPSLIATSAIRQSLETGTDAKSASYISLWHDLWEYQRFLVSIFEPISP